MKKRVIWINIHRGVKIIAIVTTFFTINSCGLTLLKLSGNLKNPKLENAESVKRYSIRKKDPYDILWVSKTKDDFENTIKKYSAIPEVLIFDKKYSLLKNAGGKECHKMLITFFTDSLIYKYDKIQDNSYINLKSMIVPIDSIGNLDDYDYTIIYMWTKYVPKLTTQLFRRLQDVKASHQHKILFISLNKDWQQSMYNEAPHFSRLNKNHNKKKKKSM